MQVDRDASDLAAEQAYLRYAEKCLERMRRRAESGPPHVAHTGAAHALRQQQELRRSHLNDPPDQPAFFGRYDETAGATWYIGRRHIHDADHDPVVVEWRAPVAVPYYRASRQNPLGVARRRTFTFDGNRLTGVDEESFEPRTTRPAVPSPLSSALRGELDRHRSGTMRDIVATIQSEQDELIRMPLKGLLVVQGGAGTGKTAIGLHRAAFLLYEHPVLRRRGVLLVGPSQLFLDYIARVLPSLGEEAVTQRSVDQLVEGLRPTLAESREVQRLKGEGRMAAVLARLVAAHRRPLRKNLYFQVDEAEFALTVGAARRLLDAVRSRGLPHNQGRAALREELRIELYRSSRAALPKRAKATKISRMVQYLTATGQLDLPLDRMWPHLASDMVVRQLLADRRLLARRRTGSSTGTSSRPSDGLAGPPRPGARATWHSWMRRRRSSTAASPLTGTSSSTRRRIFRRCN
jgi:hypothetical protein